jgi:hypothetical protein
MSASYARPPLVTKPPSPVPCLWHPSGRTGWYTVFNTTQLGPAAPKRLELVVFGVPRGKAVLWASCWPQGGWVGGGGGQEGPGTGRGTPSWTLCTALEHMCG